MVTSVYSKCAFCDAADVWCDASFGGFPCTRCRSMRRDCCALGKVPLESYAGKDGLGGSPADVSGTSVSVFRHEIEPDSLGGMASNSLVHLTQPLDNLISELHNILGLDMDAAIGMGGHIRADSLYTPAAFEARLPAFIQAMPESVTGSDTQFLESKGVFSLPDPVLRDELLCSFVENVYPFLPVLDLHSFLVSAVGETDALCSNPISLLLFHAVMFSATAFIEVKHLHAAGYASRKQAREQYYLRARTLYDFDIESDRIVLIQSLLLMTYWHETPDNPKDSHYWLNVCWSLGESIGLDCCTSAVSEQPTMPTGTRAVWKRLWWCLYTRDVLLALNLRRPLSYRHAKTRYGLEELTTEEFNITCYPRRIVDALGSCGFLEDVAAQRDVALAFIDKAKLCVLVLDVLILRDLWQGTTSIKRSPPPQQQPFNDSWSEVMRALQSWRRDMRSVSAGSARDSDADPPGTPRIIHVQRAWIEVIYLAALATLHREAARGPDSGFTKKERLGHLDDVPDIPYTKIISDMTGVLEDLNHRGLVQYLPTSTVAVLVPVLLRLVMQLAGAMAGAASSNPMIQVRAFEQFYRGMQVLSTLGEVYASAREVQAFFEGLLRRGNEAMPDGVRSLLTRNEQKEFASMVLGRLRGSM
ncbi:fungal-specific transcription factor domain-containing protein [Aspergillus tetrazonus]